MEQIFESQCNEEARTVAYQNGPDDGRFAAGVAIMTGPPGASFCLFLEKEDSEALARAILGIPDPPPILDWDDAARVMRDDFDRVQRSNLAYLQSVGA